MPLWLDALTKNSKVPAETTAWHLLEIGTNLKCVFFLVDLEITGDKISFLHIHTPHCAVKFEYASPVLALVHTEPVLSTSKRGYYIHVPCCAK